MNNAQFKKHEETMSFIYFCKLFGLVLYLNKISSSVLKVI